MNGSSDLLVTCEEEGKLNPMLPLVLVNMKLGLPQNVLIEVTFGTLKKSKHETLNRRNYVYNVLEFVAFFQERMTINKSRIKT